MKLLTGRLRWQNGLPVLAAAGLGLLYQQTARPVQLVVDGQGTTISTHSERVGQVLLEAGYGLAPEDQVSPTAQTLLSWDGETIPVVRLDRAAPVLVETGGAQQMVYSASSAPADLVELAGGLLFIGDRVQVDGLPFRPTSVPTRPEQVLHLAGHSILLTDGGATNRGFYSAAPTVGQALWEAGIEIAEGDRIAPPPQTVLDGPVAVTLTRGQVVQVRLGDTVVSGRSAAATVAEALAEIGTPLAGLDYSMPDAGGPLPADGQIELVRVAEHVQLEQRPLPFETLFQPLETLEIDQRQLVQPGSYGVIAEQVRVRSENGREVSRSVESQWVAQEPVGEIVGYGTQIVIRSVATDDGQLEYWRAVQMYATSYSASRAGIPPGHPWFGITASGKPLKKGLVAIDRSLIPFGTQMYVPGYGFAEAADTGGGVKGRWIDLGYDDDNYVPWHQYLTVYFLTPVPPPGSIVYIFP